MTPDKPRGRNLVIAKATSAAEAAAARLDQLNTEGQQPASGRAKRKSDKARKAKGKRRANADRELAEASTYQARSWESMLLYQRTEGLFRDEGEGHEEERHDSDDMPPLDGEGARSSPELDSKEQEGRTV